MENINGISYYLNKYYMLSNTSQMTIFFFQEDSAQVHCACNTVELSEKCHFRGSPVLPGSAEEYLRWHSKESSLLVTFLPKNIKISKSIHVCKSYSKPKVGRFVRHYVNWVFIQPLNASVVNPKICSLLVNIFSLLIELRRHRRIIETKTLAAVSNVQMNSN